MGSPGHPSPHTWAGYGSVSHYLFDVLLFLLMVWVPLSQEREHVKVYIWFLNFISSSHSSHSCGQEFPTTFPLGKDFPHSLSSGCAFAPPSSFSWKWLAGCREGESQGEIRRCHCCGFYSLWDRQKLHLKENLLVLWSNFLCDRAVSELTRGNGKVVSPTSGGRSREPGHPEPGLRSRHPCGQQSGRAFMRPSDSACAQLLRIQLELCSDLCTNDLDASRKTFHVFCFIIVGLKNWGTGEKSRWPLQMLIALLIKEPYRHANIITG